MSMMSTAAIQRQRDSRLHRGQSSQLNRARTRRKMPEMDYFLLFLGVSLLLFGLLMVTSASLHLGDRIGMPFYFTGKHTASMIIGLLAGFVILQIPTNQWQKYSVQMYAIGLFLLILLLIPGVGRTVNGATRWIPLGVFNLQSSEFMKLFVVLYLAGYLVRRHVEVRHSVKGFVNPMLLLGIACILIILQPDFGTMTVILVTALGMLFLGGAPLWQFLALITFVGAALVGLVISSPYRMARITGFLDPWADVNGSGYQLAQALIAFGRGEWAGVGFGNGIQKQFYLPEAHTDFIMAVIGEEFGLLGTVAVILLMSLLVWRAFSIGTDAIKKGRRFAAYVSYGVAVWIGFQSFVNTGVNVGLLPTKGITMPFLSFGGNSIIVSCLVLMMLMRIDYENRQLDAVRGKKSWQAM